MNITCHSSFDTNLRIRISTPTGQKDVASNKGIPKIDAAGGVPKQAPPASEPTFLAFDGHSKSFTASCQHQFSQYSVPPPPAVFSLESSSFGNLGLCSTGDTGLSHSNNIQFNGAWGLDFQLEPQLEHSFAIPMDVSMAAAAVLPPINWEYYGSGTTVGIPISDSEGSVSSNEPVHKVTKEWTPRRRKRPSQTSKEGPLVENQAAKRLSEATAPDHRRNQAHQTVNNQTSKWAIDKFVLGFIGECHPQSPLRLAILAWVEQSSAVEKQIALPIVEDWYTQASEQVETLLVMPDPTLELGGMRPVKNVAENIICAILFLNRCDLLRHNLEAVSSRLDRITNWLSKHTGALNISGFASKLLLWSCYLQVRISIFSNTAPQYATLLDVLNTRADYHHILEQSHNFCLDMFGDGYPQEQLAEDLQDIPVSMRLHDTFCLLAELLRYRYLQRNYRNAQGLGSWKDLAAQHASIDSEIQRLDNEFDMAAATIPAANILRRGPLARPFTTASAVANNHMSSESANIGRTAPTRSPTPPSSLPPRPGRTSLHWLTAYASFLTVKILWSRAVLPNIRTDKTSAEAVESILQVALLLRRFQDGETHDQVLSPMLWPLPLFVAGIETVDEVRADWIRLFMSGIEAGKEPGRCLRLCSGASGKDAIELMEQVRKRQDEVGTRVDVDFVMAEVGGAKCMFAF